MEKCIVTTIGDKSYLSPLGEDIRHSRPTVVEKSTFVDTLRDDGKIVIHAVGLPKEATDAEFFTTYHEAKKDAALAIEAFCAEHGVDVKGVAVATEKKGASDEKPLSKAEKKAKEKAEKEAKEAEEKAAAEAAEGQGQGTEGNGE